MRKLATDGPQPEPGGPQAALLALLVHVLFFAFLFFAVSWRTEPPKGMVAELWTSLPPPTPQPRAAEPKPEPAKPAPEPPKPEPMPEPKVEPKPVEQPKPQPRPDILLKEKAEQEKKRAEEEKKKQEAEKRRLDQQKAAEAEKARREQAKQAEQVAKLAREQEALNRKLEAEAAAGQARLLEDYTGRIKAKIQRYIVMPPDVPGNPEARFDVVLLPSGDVLSAKLKKSSGHPAYDAAVERAILKAQPLPLPPDPGAFANFRNLELRFRPVE
jgi:colicin import membrane protein